MAYNAYDVKILKHSKNVSGVELITGCLTYPRVMHAELMTHKMLSKNSASSRAIPVHKLLSMTEANTWEPIRWGKNQAGMQAAMEDLEGEALAEAKAVWNEMAQACLKGVRRLTELNLHKQWANRPIEWMGSITIVLSGTDLKNFFALRDHHMAFPEFGHVAAMYRDAIAASVPQLLQPGEWHMPYTDDIDVLEESYTDEEIRFISAGRCARVSYLTQEGIRNPDEDIALCQRLIGQRPGHWSPLEHVAEACLGRVRIRNFRGFRQLRDFHDFESYET